MNILKLKSQFKNIKTKARSQLDHIWTNFCKSIYMAFKLPNTLPFYNIEPISSPFI